MAEFVANYRLADGTSVAERVEAASIEAATEAVTAKLLPPVLVLEGADERERVVVRTASVTLCEVTTPDLYEERMEDEAGVVINALEHSLAGERLLGGDLPRLQRR